MVGRGGRGDKKGKGMGIRRWRDSQIYTFSKDATHAANVTDPRKKNSGEVRESVSVCV